MDSYKIPKFGLILACAGGILTVCPFLQDPYSLPKLFIIALGCAIAWLNERKRYQTILDGPIMAMLIVAAMATLLSVDPVRSLMGKYLCYRSGLLTFGLCALLFYAATKRGDYDLDDCMAWVVAAAGISGLFGIGQKLGIQFSWMADMPTGRIYALSGNPVFLGSVFVLALPAAVHLIARKIKPHVRVGVFALVTMIPALLLTMTRGAYIAAFIGTITYIFLTQKKLRKWILVANVSGVLLLALGMGYSQFFRTLKNSDTLRIETWRVAALSIVERPILGSGPATFDIGFRRLRSKKVVEINKSVGQDSAHNDILEVGVCLGLVGLAVYLWLILALFQVFRYDVQDPGVAAVAGAVLGVFIQAKFNPIPISVMVVCSVWIGMCASRSSVINYGPSYSRSVAMSLAVFTAFLVALDFTYKKAVYCTGRGKLAYAQMFYRNIQRIAPWHENYAIAHHKFLLDRAGNFGSRAYKLTDSVLSLGLAEQMLRWHPQQASTHIMIGLSQYHIHKYGGSGDLYAARRHLMRANIAAPMFPSVLKTRALVGLAIREKVKLRSR